MRVAPVDFFEVFDALLILLKALFVRKIVQFFFPEDLSCLCLFLDALYKAEGFQVFILQDLYDIVPGKAGQRLEESCFFPGGLFFFLFRLLDEPGLVAFCAERHARDTHLIDNDLAEEELHGLEGEGKGCYLHGIFLGIVRIRYFNSPDRNTQRREFQVDIIYIHLCTDQVRGSFFHGASGNGVDQYKPEAQEQGGDNDERNKTFPPQPFHHEPSPDKLSEVYVL